MGSKVFDLLDPEAEWPYVREHLSGIQFYIDVVNKAPAEKLKQFVQLIRERKYQVAIECGGTLDFAPMNSTNGERSAAIELAKIDKFYAAGGKVDFLNIDGPIRRLMHPKNKRRGSFDSVEKAADELVDYLRIVRRAHPELRFFLLTNFPNWGYRGDVSYHARGPARQDYGDYDTVVRVVLNKLEAADIQLAGVTVDNPYEYLVGSHMSVKLKDPTTVNWINRVRSYEDFARSRGLKFNLIANSEAGGKESDELFYTNTLKMIDAYVKAGGRPDRWFIQSWYEHPVRVVPESARFSMTALIKAAMHRVEIPRANRRAGRRDAAPDSGRIVLTPRQGTMAVTARVPALDDQSFTLGIPETIGCREAMLVNFPEAKIKWKGPDADGIVSCAWGPGGRIHYATQLIPAGDYVDVEMTVTNHTEFHWHDVFAFNCLNPTRAPAFKDWKLERTYMSSNGKPLRMSQTKRREGHVPTLQFYLPDTVAPGGESVFVRGFDATSDNRTDGSWIVTLSEPSGSYMAATSPRAAFLFDNLDRCCIHSAPLFGDIAPRKASTTLCRLYFAKGSLETFLERYETDKAAMAKRRK